MFQVLEQAGLAGVPLARVSATRCTIALLDGIIDVAHPCFRTATIKQCTTGSLDFGIVGTRHATLVGSILVGEGPDALGVCAGCSLVSIPVADHEFELGRLTPALAANRIASAICAAVDLGVSVILLSMAFAPQFNLAWRPIINALERMARLGCLAVVATGNDGALGGSSVLAAPGVIPVALADTEKLPHRKAALGPTLGMRGLMAPGVDVLGAFPGGGFVTRSGSSYAAAIVAGTLARLKCHFPNASCEQLIQALLGPKSAESSRQTIVPPHLDGLAAYVRLKNSLCNHLRRKYYERT